MTLAEFLPLAFDAFMKTTLVLAAAGGTALLLRKRAASLRHLAWTSALAGALAMPLVAGLAPQWSAPVKLPLPLRTVATPVAEMPHATLAADRQQPLATTPAQLEAAAVTVDKLPPMAMGSVVEPMAPSRPVSALAIALAVWAAGSVLLLAWTLRSHLRARALVRRARTLHDPELATWLGRSPMGERVRIVESSEIDVPLATGLLNPVLVVPAGFQEWSLARRRIVLLHELAHVERGDCLAQAIARTAVALWWFHPLAWFALDRLKREAEQAADDRVLESGTRPSEYAAHLLAVVRSLTARPDTAAGFSMAGSDVERRLLALLDPSRSRRRLSPAAIALCTLAVAGSVTALGGLRADAHPHPAAPHQASGLGSDHGHDHLGQGDWKASLVGDHDHGHGGGIVQWAKRQLTDRDEGAEAFDEAMARHRRGDWEASAEGFQRAHELGYAKGTSAFNVACAHARQGYERKAVEWLEQAFDDGFGDLGALDSDEDIAFLRGSRHFERFRETVEERVAESERLRSEKKRRALNQRVDELEHVGEFAGAEAYKLGYDLHGVQDWAGAERAWRKAAELGYSPANSHYNVACALARQGHGSEALDWLEKSLALGFDDWSNMEQDDDLASLRERARYRDLLGMADALELPGDVNDLEQIAEDRAKWEAFTRKSGELTRRHPEMGKAWLRHGMGLLRTDRYDESAAAFRRAAELGQSEGLCAYNEACALAKAGRKDRAVEALGRALELGFGNAEQISEDPDLASLEGHRGFEELKAKYPEESGAWNVLRKLKEQAGYGERQVY